MYVYEEMIDGQKLTDIINTEHENVKYLPGHKLPPNVVSVKCLIDLNPFYDKGANTICATLNFDLDTF